jgi:hypothetical protein
MASYMMQDVSTGVTLWKRCLKRLGWLDPEPGTYVWPQLPIDIEHELALIILQQSEDGVCFNTDKAVELSRQLSNAQAQVGQELKDHFGAWWQASEAKPIVKTMKRKLKGHADVTVPRRGKQGRVLAPYVGAPWEERDEGSLFTPIEWTEFSPGSRDHLAKRLTDLYGWTPGEFGKDGKPKLDETVLEGIPDHIVPRPIRTKVLQYFKLTKTLGMLSVGRKAWLRLVAEDGRMHGTMDTCGAITSRAIHKDPNLSQVPKVAVDGDDNEPVAGIEGGFGQECRELFEADSGWELTGIDITALELVTLGHFLHRWDGGAFSERACNPDMDIHVENSKLTGVPRAATKTCTYLYVYGGGAWKLTFKINITDEEIPTYLGYKGLPGLLAGLRKRFGDTYKEPDDRGKALLAKARTIILKFEAGITGIKDLVEDVKVAAGKGWLRGLDGRKLVVRASKAHAALAPLNQGAGSIVCKLWLVNADKALRAAGLKHGEDYKQILWSHDEAQFTHRPGLGPKIAEIVLGALEPTAKTLGLRGKLRGAAKTGFNWAQTH